MVELLILRVYTRLLKGIAPVEVAGQLRAFGVRVAGHDQRHFFLDGGAFALEQNP
ncbi:MAG: hypothetical protein KatS3mg051_0804 [Anaerolineae bacterium]|nr:MAG: hypothetical protein KatS3mg051_0804 [Anaerolineae bacterium]